MVNANFECKSVRLDSCSEIIFISLNLDGFSKLGIGPKYDPIRTLKRGKTYQINISNTIVLNLILEDDTISLIWPIRSLKWVKVPEL